MFLEKYSKFKQAFNNPKDVYENYSIGKNPLFGLDDYYSPKYLNNEIEIGMNFINQFDKELYDTYLKYKFIESYLLNYHELQKEESIKLDNEYTSICSSLSTKGQAFLEMFNLPEHYNNVLDLKTVFLKNVIEYNNISLKTSETMSELDYYLDYIDKNRFFIVFDNFYQIKNILLSFYNFYNISIFGVKEDETMENLFDSVSTEQEIFINVSEEKYSKLYILSNSDIVDYIKDVKVFSYKEDNGQKCGYLIKKLSKLDLLESIIIVNDVNTSFYLYSPDEYNNLISLLSTNENEAKGKYINNNYKVETNINISLNNYSNSEMYLLEFFDYNNHKSYVTNIYGKEK